MQVLGSSSALTPGSPAAFVIWVWSLEATSPDVTVKAHVAPAVAVGTPAFNVCPSADGASCKVGNLPAGQADELQVTVPVGATASNHELVTLTATASASGEKSFSSSASYTVLTSTSGVTSIPALTLPPTDLPAIDGTGTTPGDVSGLFPTVQGSPASGSSGRGRPAAKARGITHAADASATVPLDARLIGGQIVGLAVLAGAVAIAIARLSLRTANPSLAAAGGTGPIGGGTGPAGGTGPIGGGTGPTGTGPTGTGPIGGGTGPTGIDPTSPAGEGNSGADGKL